MTLKSGEYPWIIVDANKYPDGKQSFICTRCGKRNAILIDGLSIDSFLRLSEAFCELHKDCNLHNYINIPMNAKKNYELKADKIIKEFDKLNTDDFCAWLLHCHIDMFKKLHGEYLRNACLTPEEKKEFRIDFDLIKKELKTHDKQRN